MKKRYYSAIGIIAIVFLAAGVYSVNMNELGSNEAISDNSPTKSILKEDSSPIYRPQNDASALYTPGDEGKTFVDEFGQEYIYANNNTKTNFANSGEITQGYPTKAAYFAAHGIDKSVISDSTSDDSVVGSSSDVSKDINYPADYDFELDGEINSKNSEPKYVLDLSSFNCTIA